MSDDNALVARDPSARPSPDSISSRDARDALERSLCARLGMCSPDELRVLDAILSGIEVGRDTHGPLDLSKPRDWEREEAEEKRDGGFYRACALISRQDQERRELRAAAALEMVENGLHELAEFDAAQAQRRREHNAQLAHAERTPIGAPAVNFAFDMTDEERD